MALLFGQAALPSNFVVTDASGGAGNIAGGTGSFVTFLCGSGTYTMNTGHTGDFAPANIREVGPGDPNNFGRKVQLNGAGPSFQGIVIAAINIELGTTGGTGALTPCVFVKPLNSLIPPYIARVSDVTFLS